MQYIWSFREREVAVAVLSLLCEGCLELVIEQLLQEVSHSANASVTSPLQELSVRDRGLVGEADHTYLRDGVNRTAEGLV